MGVSPFKFSCSLPEKNYSYSQVSGNPNKYRFTIKKEEYVNDCVVALINYPDCTTYGGDKILVFNDVKEYEKLKTNKAIDPHFLDKEYSPVARFLPTEAGWIMAIECAGLMSPLLKVKIAR